MDQGLTDDEVISLLGAGEAYAETLGRQLEIPGDPGDGSGISGRALPGAVTGSRKIPQIEFLYAVADKSHHASRELKVAGFDIL